MPTIIFTTPDGKQHDVSVDEGVTVMEAGRDANLGIEGTCGGCLSCATCHVIVDDAWISNVGEPSDNEDSMLDLNPDRQPNSRLSCQIEMTDDLDDIVVNLPEFQY